MLNRASMHNRYLRSVIFITVLFSLYTLSFAEQAVLPLTNRTLINWASASSGQPGGKIGMWERPKGYVYETLMYADLSSLSGAIISNVTFRVTRESYTAIGNNTTMALYVQDKGAYDPLATYDTYPDTNWTTALGTGTIDWEDSNGTVYSITGPSLVSEVQSWIDNSANNQGLILGGSSNSDAVFMNFSKSDLVVDYTIAQRYKANNSIDLNLGTSWTQGSVPQPNDTVIWDNRVTGANTVNTGGDHIWGGIKIIDPGGTVLINDNMITLGSGGINMSAATQNLVINSQLTIATAQVFNVNSMKALIFEDTIFGNSRIIKSGSGTLVFIGDACAFSGSIQVDEGIMQVGAGNTSGCFGGNITNNSMLVFNRNDSHSYVDTLSGTGTVIKEGSGMLYFTKPSTFTGDLTVEAGIIKMYIDSNPQNSGFYQANSITIDSTATILVGKNNSLYGYGVTTGNVLTINRGGLLNTVDSIVGQIKARVILNGGEISAGAPHSIYGSWEFDDDVTVNGEDTSTISALHASWDEGETRDFNVANALGVLNVTGSFWEADTFPAHLSKSGAGKMILHSSSNYTGLTTISEGVLCILQGDALGTTDGRTVVESGASLEIEGDITCPESLVVSGTGINNSGAIRGVNGTSTLSGRITLNGDATIEVAGDLLTCNNAIIGTGNLTKTGAGDLSLSGTNSITGDINIEEGELWVGGTINNVVNISSGAVISGLGIVGTMNIANGGIVKPGINFSGKLNAFNDVNLSNSSIINIDLGLKSDTLSAEGDLILDGILNIDSLSGFTPGIYTVMTYGGALTDNVLSIGTVPNSNYSYDVIAGNGKVELIISSNTTITIDADGPADYSDFDSLMIDLENNVINPDIIKFIGTNRDSFNFTTTVNDVGLDEILFVSETTEPDSFPVIYYSPLASDFYMNTTVNWEGIVFTGDTYFDFNLNGTGRDHSFNNCVFRDFGSTMVIHARLEDSGSLSLTNCLLENNVASQGVVNGYMDDAGTSSIKIINCTFDSNTVAVEAGFAGNWDNYLFKNCIFNYNTENFSSDSLKARTTYSLTNKFIDGYGTGCKGPTIAGFESDARNVPSDWQLVGGAPAINVGTITDAPLFDISGVPHGVTISAGCWAGLENNLPISADKFIAIEEDSSYTFSISDFYFSDEDTVDTLVKIKVTALETAGALQLNGVDITIDQEIISSEITKLTFIPAADSNGTNYSNFSFKVSDGVDYSSSAYLLSFNVSAVNDAPIVISPITDMVVNEFISDSIHADLNNVFFDVEDGTSLTFTAASQSSDIVAVSIDSTDSLLLVGFANVVSDTVKIFVNATDLGGLKAQDTFMVILDRLNDAPVVVNPIADVIVFEDNKDTTIVDLNDVFLDTEEQSSLTFSAISLDPTLVIPVINTADSSLILTSIGSQENGNSAIIVTATDKYGTSVSDTFSVIIVERNDVPVVIDSIVDIVVMEDAADTVHAILTNVFMDEEDGTFLTYGVYSLGQNIVSGSIINDTLLLLSFVENAHGTANVVISATDGANAIGYDTIQVTVISVNDAPVLHSITPWAMEEGYPYDIPLSQVYSSDVEGDELSIIVDTGANYTVDSLTVYPKIGFVGKLIIPLSVTDGVDTSNKLTVTVDVKYVGVNRPPILTSANISPIEKNGSLRVTTDMLNAFDPDGDSLTILIWAGDSYTMQGTLIIPDKGFTGVLEVLVQVTDGIGLSGQLLVKVSVFEKVIDFYKGQIINSDTYEASIGPNPLSAGSRELYFISELTNSNYMEIIIFDELANVIHRGEVENSSGKFNYLWEIEDGSRYRGRAYFVLMNYYRDDVIVRREKRMIGVKR